MPNIYQLIWPINRSIDSYHTFVRLWHNDLDDTWYNTLRCFSCSAAGTAGVCSVCVAGVKQRSYLLGRKRG